MEKELKFKVKNVRNEAKYDLYFNKFKIKWDEKKELSKLSSETKHYGFIEQVTGLSLKRYNYCPNCGTPVTNQDYRFCVVCGFNLF